MSDVKTVTLPGVVHAAAAGPATVWCASADRLLAFDEAGSTRYDVAAPAGLSSLAAAGETLVGTAKPGVVVWLDPLQGTVHAQLPIGGEPVVASGGGAVWVYDAASDRAAALPQERVRAEPVALGGVHRFAADGSRFWWTSPDDTVLRGADRPVDLGVGPGQRGALVACSGSIWVSIPDGLLRVGAWAGELGPRMAAPEGPIEHLACADGILVGGSGRRGLFTLNPSIDADVRVLDVDLGGDLAHLVTTRTTAWAIPAGKAEARLVTVRPGR